MKFISTVFPPKSTRGAHLKVSLPGGGHSRRGAHLQICFFGGRLFHFLDIRTQSFPKVVSSHINGTYDEIGNTWKWSQSKNHMKMEKLHSNIKERVTKQCKFRPLRRYLSACILV